MRKATQAQAVRTWAAGQGYEVSGVGRIAPAVWEAYARAHPDYQRETPPGTWGCHCGRRWTGLKECHCTVCHRHFSTPANFDAHRPYGQCADPVGMKVAGKPLKERATVWGTIYVADDDSGFYGELF